MAKRTPDYTKQVRHEKPSRQPAPPRNKTARRTQVPPPQKGAAGAVYVSLAGGTAVYLYAAYLATGSATAKTVTFSLVIAACGVLVNVLTGVLATYALFPRRFPMPRVDKKLLVVMIMVFGAVTVFFGLQITWLAPGIIPPVAVFFFLIRPRLKAIAQAAGTYRLTKRDAALEEIQARREERQREREREEQLKEREKQIKAALKRRQEHDRAGGAAGGRTSGPGPRSSRGS